MLSNQNTSSRQNYQTVHLTNTIHLNPTPPKSGLWCHLHPVLHTGRLALAESLSLFQTILGQSLPQEHVHQNNTIENPQQGSGTI